MAKNTSRRKKDIKSKLVAAICMLLVSTIMMVSSTYAWFTLSTAPEVSGITTTIGSNGNLEIALSPLSGLGSDVGDAGLNTGDGWGAKNLTWGNLVDMGYARNTYGLDQLTLAPALLALSTNTDGDFVLGENALGTPSYGSDGRISGLNANAFIAGKDEDATGFGTVDADYGVRAVGTSSGLSAQAAKHKNAVSNIGNYATAAVTAAANSLAENGDALAAMLVMHAEAGSGTDTTNNYAKYVPALVALTEDLNDSVENINEALRAALAAAATTIQDEDTFNTAISAIEGKTDGEYNNTIEGLVAQASTLGFTVPSGFDAIITARDEIEETIEEAASAADELMERVDTTDVAGTGDPDGIVDLDADGNPVATILWSDVSSVLTDLMNANNTSSIKISSYTVDQIKEKMDDMDFLLGLATNCQIELGDGSGLYYDIAEITGNITAKVPEVPVSARGISVTLKNVIIKTTVPANTSLLPNLKTTAAAITPGGDNSNQVIDAYYGYVIDLMVRTNAADSDLLLQTTPAQRVYDDSANEDTLGKGTSIVFTTADTDDLASIQNLVKSIRIVFFDPTHGDEVFGIAKATSVTITDGKVDQTVDGTTTQVDGHIITGYFELCEPATVTGSYYEAGEVLDSNVLCPLTQNVPQAISALVYLDGQDVTSADVLADENVVGALNLQFASSADLQPMDNSDLFNGTTQNP